MARNAISLSTYADFPEGPWPCDVDGRVSNRRGKDGKSDVPPPRRRWAGPFKVVWREDVQAEGEGPKRAQRGQRVSDLEALRKLTDTVRRALEGGKGFVPEARKVAAVASLDGVAASYLRHQKTDRRSEGTMGVYRDSLARIFSSLRSLQGIATDVPVPVDVLSIGLGAELRSVWTAEDEAWSTSKKERAAAKRAKKVLPAKRGRAAGAMHRYNLALLLLNVWQHGVSLAFASMPAAPLDGTLFTGTAPKLGAVGDEPMISECDAVVRRAYAEDREYGDLLAGERYTGLRVEQVVSIRRGAVDVVRAELIVEVGKGEQEKADMRRIPIARALLDLWSDRLQTDDPDVLLFGRAGGGEGHMIVDTGRITAWWAAAVAAGEVRPGIHNPPNRRNNRPDHAFRAAFMGYLEDLEVEVAGIGPVRIVDDKTIDYLVGHAPRTVRDRSYKKPKASRLRAAVDRLPPIDFGADVSNVVPLRG